ARPNRGRQRPWDVPVPDQWGLPARRLRSDGDDDQRGRQQRVSPGWDPEFGVHLQLLVRRAAARLLRSEPVGLVVLERRRVPVTPGSFPFGVCAPGGTSPICSVDPGTVAKVMDTIVPGGVPQQDQELDPTKGPVVLAGTAVP